MYFIDSKISERGEGESFMDTLYPLSSLFIMKEEFWWMNSFFDKYGKKWRMVLIYKCLFLLKLKNRWLKTTIFIEP